MQAITIVQENIRWLEITNKSYENSASKLKN